MRADQIAHVCHDALVALAKELGNELPPWENLIAQGETRARAEVLALSQKAESQADEVMLAIIKALSASPKAVAVAAAVVVESEPKAEAEKPAASAE